MRRIHPAILAAAAIGLLLVIAAIVMMNRPSTAAQDKLSDAQAAGAGASAPAKRCASQATYDRIKLEIFRQASQTRSSDRALFDKLAAYASVRVERPLLRSHDDELGTVRCAGRLTIDLPPGVAVGCAGSECGATSRGAGATCGAGACGAGGGATPG